MRPPLDEPEFNRWREEADRALSGAAREAEARITMYVADDSAAALQAARELLDLVDRTWESLG